MEFSVVLQAASSTSNGVCVNNSTCFAFLLSFARDFSIQQFPGKARVRNLEASIHDDLFAFLVSKLIHNQLVHVHKDGHIHFLLLERSNGCFRFHHNLSAILKLFVGFLEFLLIDFGQVADSHNGVIFSIVIIIFFLIATTRRALLFLFVLAFLLFVLAFLLFVLAFLLF